MIITWLCFALDVCARPFSYLCVKSSVLLEIYTQIRKRPAQTSSAKHNHVIIIFAIPYVKWLLTKYNVLNHINKNINISFPPDTDYDMVYHNVIVPF